MKGKFFVKRCFLILSGMTFKWLIENAPGWVAFVVAEIEISGEPKGTGNRWLNKMALRKYVNLFEEGRELVSRKTTQKQKEKSSKYHKVLQNVFNL